MSCPARLVSTPGHLGKHEASFDNGEPERYRKDVPNAQIHVVEGGHFALDSAAVEIAVLVDDFMKSQK